MIHRTPAPMTLLEAMLLFYPESSRRTLQQWIKNGRVLVENSIVSKANHLLETGQQVKLGKKEHLQPTFQGIKILYQDRWMIVIDKPIGLLSVAADDPEKPHALGLLRNYFHSPSIFPVHRIDRETSGVLLFARGTSSQEKFDALFEAHLIDREYLAIVEGNLPVSQGTWKSYLLEKENYDVVTTIEGQGRLAITHYDIIRRSKKFSYLRLKLETGRKHQIRVHCKEAGHPVLGDERYGSLLNPIGRLCLHAHVLGFIHPFTGKKVRFVSQPPATFKRLGM